MLLNCRIEEDSWESLGLQGDPTSPFWRRSVLGFIGKTDDEAETPIFWPPDAKTWLIWKDSDAGKDWRREEKGMTEDEMVGWHHWLNGHEFQSTPGVADGQGGLVCCSPWGHKESNSTEQLNWLTMPSFRGSSWPRDRACISNSSDISCIGKQVLYHLYHLGSRHPHPYLLPKDSIITFVKVEISVSWQTLHIFNKQYGIIL